MLPILTNPAVLQAARMVGITVALSAVAAGTQRAIHWAFTPKPVPPTPEQRQLALKVSLAVSAAEIQGIPFEQVVQQPEFQAACQALDATLIPIAKLEGPAPAAPLAA